jgi:hypothetical protein
MSGLQKRGNYLPREQRERQAYRLIILGGASGVVGAVGVVLAIAGVISASLPVVALIAMAICMVLFRRMMK